MVNDEKLNRYPLPTKFKTKLLPQGCKEGGPIKIWRWFMVILSVISRAFLPELELEIVGTAQASFVDHGVVQVGG